MLAAGAALAYDESRPEVAAFAKRMQTQYGFDPQEVLEALAPVEPNQTVLRFIQPATTEGARSWPAYRKRYVEPVRLKAGLAFWREYADDVRRASRQMGVPEEIIVAIIGIETIYGRQTGKFETRAALATLAFDYPARSALFTRELENLFLLAREQKEPISSFRGSFAGAIGYPQFLPSSIRTYAVDFDGSGQIDLNASPVDAIGSVANFLKQHGWQTGQPVAVPARVESEAALTPFLAADIQPVWHLDELSNAGVSTQEDIPPLYTAALLELPNPRSKSEYWLGFQNFYVITRYNRSTFYAMSVFQFAQALRERM